MVNSPIIKQIFNTQNIFMRQSVSLVNIISHQTNQHPGAQDQEPPTISSADTLPVIASEPEVMPEHRTHGCDKDGLDKRKPTQVNSN